MPVIDATYNVAILICKKWRGLRKEISETYPMVGLKLFLVTILESDTVDVVGLIFAV